MTSRTGLAMLNASCSVAPAGTQTQMSSSAPLPATSFFQGRRCERVERGGVTEEFCHASQQLALQGPTTPRLSRNRSI